jgi:DNA-directed RNA polymerase subunit E'/Rpb7
MHAISILNKDITVEPKHLTKDIKEYIFSELKKKYEKTCSDTEGLIISIEHIISIDNIINKDSIHITFSVIFQALTIKPEKDMIISFIPSLILSKGIFGKLYDNINFFIPESSLKQSGYIFDTDTNVFKKDSDSERDSERETETFITCKTEVNTIIEQLKYDTVKYNCIVRLT